MQVVLQVVYHRRTVQRVVDHEHDVYHAYEQGVFVGNQCLEDGTHALLLRLFFNSLILAVLVQLIGRFFKALAGCVYGEERCRIDYAADDGEDEESLGLVSSADQLNERQRGCGNQYAGDGISVSSPLTQLHSLVLIRCNSCQQCVERHVGGGLCHALEQVGDGNEDDQMALFQVRCPVAERHADAGRNGQILQPCTTFTFF